MKPILTALALMFATSVFGQNDTLGFPFSWQGEWAGTLDIFNARGKVQSLPMELHILPTDSSANLTWTLLYGEDKVAGRRAYELVIVDTAQHRYLIDEKNSIKMEGYYLAGKFYQWFEVQGSLLLTTTQLVGEELHWEIVVGKLEPASVTGGEVVDGEEIPPVQAFPVTGVQRAVLLRRP